MAASAMASFPTVSAPIREASASCCALLWASSGFFGRAGEQHRLLFFFERDDKERAWAAGEGKELGERGEEHEGADRADGLHVRGAAAGRQAASSHRDG